jgi:hypothetical protein
MRKILIGEGIKKRRIERESRGKKGEGNRRI